MTHLDIYNTSYGKKKGWASNWQFDSRPQKVENQPDFRVSKWLLTHCWKAFNESYNFALDLVPIGGLSAKLWPCEVVGVSTLTITRLPFGSLETKSHLDVAFVEKCRVYYMGEGGGFP
jgi:hypothetical protein